MASNAQKHIQEKLKAAYDAIREAQEIADKHGEQFSFDVVYGMGGTYFPKGYRPDEYESDYLNESSLQTKGQWVPSSHTC